MSGKAMSEGIIIEIDDQSFEVELQISKAQKTVEAFLKLLPYESKTIHARWSGEAMWIPLPKNLMPEVTVLENQTSYPSRGEILYYPGFVSEKEILIPYGAAIFSSRVGMLPGTHFATIKNSQDKLLEEIGKRVLWEGAKKVIIRQP